MRALLAMVVSYVLKDEKLRETLRCLVKEALGGLIEKITNKDK